MEFTEAESNMNDLVSEYQQYRLFVFRAHALNFTFRITLPLACDSSAQQLLNAKQLNFGPFCTHFVSLLDKSKQANKGSYDVLE